MSVQKKSLIGDRTAVKKAIIASKPDTTPVGEPMKVQQVSLKARKASLHAPKANSLHSMKAKRIAFKGFKTV
jgi:hypothetical protein